MKLKSHLTFLLDRYCADHARRTAILRQRAGRKRRPQETPETILEEIEHYGTTKQGDGGLVVGEVKRIRGSMDTMAHRILGILQGKLMYFCLSLNLAANYFSLFCSFSGILNDLVLGPIHA